MSDLVERLREESMWLQQTAWKRLDGGQQSSMSSALADEAADEIERLREALEVASDEILSMYRTWVADDYTAMPPEKSLPGMAYYKARAALQKAAEV